MAASGSTAGAGGAAAGEGWNASVARTDVTSAAMFGADKQGQRAGIFSGQGVTRTDPSPTLFISNIPRGAKREDVEALFAKEVGFLACRTVGRMLFVDFSSKHFALGAMRKHQGRQVAGAVENTPLLIDFDRDAGASQRARKRDSQREADEAKRRAEAITPYYCIICKGRVVFATNQLMPLQEMPRRGTDHAYCADEEAFLKFVDLEERPQPKLIRREKGIERQYELCCKGCKAPVAYRPVPLAQATRFLYVPPDGVCWSKAARTPADRWAAEAARGAARAGHAGDAGDARSHASAGAAAAGGLHSRPGGAAGDDGEEDDEDEGDEAGDYGVQPAAKRPRPAGPAAADGVEAPEAVVAEAAPVAAQEATAGETTAVPVAAGADAAVDADAAPPPSGVASPTASAAPGEAAQAGALPAAVEALQAAVDTTAWPAALRARAAAALARAAGV